MSGETKVPLSEAERLALAADMRDAGLEDVARAVEGRELAATPAEAAQAAERRAARGILDHLNQTTTGWFGEDA